MTRRRNKRFLYETQRDGLMDKRKFLMEGSACPVRHCDGTLEFLFEAEQCNCAYLGSVGAAPCGYCTSEPPLTCTHCGIKQDEADRRFAIRLPKRAIRRIRGLTA